MARINQNLNGAFSGKIGPMVGYIWKNRACIRTYRKSINYPNTEGQRQERDWFVGMVRFASRAKSALQLGLNQRANDAGMTEGNYFISLNKAHFHRNAGSVEVDYDMLTLAEGPAADVLFHSPEFGDGETVSIGYEKNMLFSRSSGEDKVYVFAYAPELAEGFLAAPSTRRTKHIDIQLPETWFGAVVHLYGFVVDRDGRASNSTYIGVGKVNHYKENGVYIPINKSWDDFVEMANRANSDGATDSTTHQNPAIGQNTGIFDIAADAPPE